ncbi:MAG TPA: hypothetical protein VEI82_05485, partial [Myxococcota bacterium]|nr:hypothetical protein [Myxococcota bacterium]
MPPRWRWLLALPAALCLAAPGAAVRADANAPESGAAAAATPAPAAAPLPTIPAPEIASRAETAKSLLQHVADDTAETPLQQEVADELPKLSPKLRERRARAEELLGGAITTAGLNDVDNEWRARARRLADWRVGLTRRAQALESYRSELADERALWERTRASAAAASLPPATVSRLDETIAALRRGERRLQTQIAAVLELQNEVAEEELVVREVVDRVAKERAEVNKFLWSRDSPPLWSGSAWVSPVGASTLRESVEDALERRLELVGEFAGPSLQRVELEAALFSAVLLAILAARRRVRAAAAAQTDAALAVPTRIVERPVSAALVVALISVNWSLPHAPGLMNELEALVLLIPVLRLLPTELFTALRPGLVALALLFVGGSVRGMF